MDISGTVADIHMRTDANNLVTTASTTHLPEQKETIHMINQLRTEACSGSIHDLAHVVSADCLADCLTKQSAKPDALVKAVDTGVLPNVDKHPPFRELMQNRHKAYKVLDGEDEWHLETSDNTDQFTSWIVYNLKDVTNILTFLGTPVRQRISYYLSVAFLI